MKKQETRRLMASKTKEEILKLWSDYEKCPDFRIVLDEMLLEIQSLKTQNKKLRECVEFYKDEKYLKEATSNNAADGYGVYKFDVDGGKKARECLKELE